MGTSEAARPGHEANHSPPHHAKIESAWSLIFAPHTCPHDMMLRHTDSFGLSYIGYLMTLSTQHSFVAMGIESKQMKTLSLPIDNERCNMTLSSSEH
jgi:hypothetical protein